MSATDVSLYFAYGSNLSAARLIERVGSVETHAIGQWRDRTLSFAKLGRDGTGKACCVRRPGDRVWGVLYRLRPDQFAELDTFEGGYRRIDVEVEVESEPAVLQSAQTYEALEIREGLLATPDYKRWIIAGAHEHGLPAAWCGRLSEIPTRSRRD